jgi:hypothetical protein
VAGIKYDTDVVKAENVLLWNKIVLFIIALISFVHSTRISTSFQINAHCHGI